MAKQRDYRAERLKRDARAQAAGFKSYRAQRYYMETKGKSRPEPSLNVTKAPIVGYTKAQVAAAHREAFYGPSAVSVRGWRPAPSAAIRRWYVDILKMYTGAEWDAKYGKPLD